jgi:choline dehydrogenase-like flavoprotein
MLSGIGDSEALQRHGIAVHHHLPAVGQDLQDHLAITIMMRTRSSESYGLSVRAFPRALWALADYVLRRRGALASNVFEAHGFVRTRLGLVRPDVQIIFVPAHRNASGFPIPVGHGFGINIALLHPKSRGSVTLASGDPHVPPVIDPNFAEVAEDLLPLVQGLTVARRILHAQPFAPCLAHEVAPGATVQSESEIEKYIRDTAFTVFHPSCTCRMGSDPAAGVDSQLRVRGVVSLRVADASIFPTLVGGNTNAAVVMVAEKAADLVLGRNPLAPMDPPWAPRISRERPPCSLPPTTSR